ncbi:hypothetical protein CONCODRAFT_13001 [Conidiobolus coronatus NRRL 28638]|uniref:Zn(2)-C6 fungal-type domain-containing protein n=1 Tax=Conidiobolus coronatus (strain ATCC 28846 / CBS 209.66 / NRRL 28638) TaxID=796925 RepID=A0A137NRN5_CONC2|nr:hypothetical protein CONCODRAFT_13001 [Conidiobolus coronatus NRRL 28638]|eukprot:KXN65405.1 hypothetical protein CONCODRAFT_13001 [Conidiobolus coronatus NRRL 28638]
MDESESLINCNMCKRIKARCSRELPKCSYCSKRGIVCNYSDQIRRRGVGEMGLTSFLSKIKVRSSVKFRELTLKDFEKNNIQVRKFILFQPISQPVDFVDESSQEIVTKLQFNNIKNSKPISY